MWNLSSSKLTVMFGIVGIGVAIATPTFAQQITLSPSGTSMLKVEGSLSSPDDFYKDFFPGITLGPGTGTSLTDDGIYGARPYTGIVQILDENTSRILTPEEVALFNQRYVKPYNPNAVNPAGQASSSILPTVTVQASQNPTADFATTRSAPRNTIPEQLNQGVIDSPLLNSRIFPGMR
jgi:hypothetical protein